MSFPIASRNLAAVIRPSRDTRVTGNPLGERGERSIPRLPVHKLPSILWQALDTVPGCSLDNALRNVSQAVKLVQGQQLAIQNLSAQGIVAHCQLKKFSMPDGISERIVGIFHVLSIVAHSSPINSDMLVVRQEKRLLLKDESNRIYAHVSSLGKVSR
jgi:hypothetical protein